ncbi:peptidase A4 family protein [Colletotrichum sojae]|uniref:Peptidase A4 family protein n=1 Tax=Colletotrichum sojae TaxID=2175907 RepID=A0A8H6ITY5_9PEZI|nr:peptidase A4 family protein [Colletotrichum sojae]
MFRAVYESPRSCWLNDRELLHVALAAAPGSETVVIKDSHSDNEADRANGDDNNARADEDSVGGGNIRLLLAFLQTTDTQKHTQRPSTTSELSRRKQAPLSSCKTGKGSMAPMSRFGPSSSTLRGYYLPPISTPRDSKSASGPRNLHLSKRNMRFSGAVLAAVLSIAATDASPTAASESQFADFDVASMIKAPASGSSVKLAAAESIKTQNWAGASKSGNNITSVTTTVTVPSIRLDPDAGIILSAQKDADPLGNEFSAFWRWLPNGGGSNNQVNFPIKTGHKIRLSINVLSPYSAKGLVENLSTGQSDSRILRSDKALCAADASWVVGRYQSMEDWMCWADFSPVTMTEVSATTGAGETLNLEGADLIDIEDGGQASTSCKIESSSSLSCAHV